MMDEQAHQIRQQIDQLKALRKRLGWSEETCAHHLGVTYATLNRWERGECYPKSQLVVSAIERFLEQYRIQPGGPHAPH